MPVSLKSTTRSLYQSLLRLLGMSNAAYIEFPANSTPIEVYYDMLGLAYALHGQDRMNMFEVQEIRLYKKVASLSQHEYATARVIGPGVEQFLCFERFGGGLHHEASKSATATQSSEAAFRPLGSDSTLVSQSLPDLSMEHTSSFPTPSQTSTHPVASLDSLSKARHADDRVMVLSGWRHDKRDEVFITHTFRQPLPLYHLAVLAKVVHQAKPAYRLFSDNCYWFAGTLVKAFKDHYDTVFKIEAGPPDMNSTTEVAKTESRARGTWNSIVVYEEKGGINLSNSKQIAKALVNFRAPIIDCEEKRLVAIHEKEYANAAAKEATRKAEAAVAEAAEATRIAQAAQAAQAAAEEARRKLEVELVDLRQRMSVTL